MGEVKESMLEGLHYHIDTGAECRLSVSSCQDFDTGGRGSGSLHV